jgi:hypothetical protein
LKKFRGLRAKRFHFSLRPERFDLDSAFGLFDLLIGVRLRKTDIA